jgi:hypothetical protein
MDLMRHNVLYTALRRGPLGRALVLVAAATAALFIWVVPGSTASTAKPAARTAEENRLVVSLALSHQSALDTYVRKLYEKGSADYHHFLKPTAFAARFGAPRSEISRTVSRLHALGLSATVAPSRLYLTVAQPAAGSEVATDLARRADHSGSPLTAGELSVTIRHALGGLASNVITPAEMPTMTPDLALPTKAGARQMEANAKRTAHARTGVSGGASPCLGAVESGAYTAPQLASAYNFNGMYAAGYHGEGMSAAVIEYGGYHPSNITAFDNCYGIHTAVVPEVVDGGVGSPANSSEAEVTLDIDTINEMAPDLADIYVYEAPDTGPGELDDYDAFVTQDKSQVLSVSWGECEEGASQDYERLLGAVTEEAAAQGQQIFVAAGDSGSTGCKGDALPTGKSVSADSEAGLPWVTGVGGTDLSQDSTEANSPVHREDVWNDGLGAGGGGESVTWSMPSWQKGYLAASGDIPDGLSNDCRAPAGDDCRMEPDISMNADAEEGGADPHIWGVPAGPTPAQFAGEHDKGSTGYSVYCASEACSDGSGLGWEPVGGTSAATPLAAAAAVLWDQQAKASGVTLGALNPPLYEVAANATDYAKDFYDITGGSNDNQYTELACLGGCTSKLYTAGTGYDMASGLGSVNVANLSGDLMANAGAIMVTPDAEQMYGDTGGGPTTTAPVSIDDTTTAATGNTYTATSNAAWLVVDRASGTTPTSLLWHVNPAGLTAGSYTGLITVTGANESTATLTVDYSVSAPAKIKLITRTLHFYETQVKPYRAKTLEVCNAPLWGDELEYGGGLPAELGLSTPGDETAGSRRSLRFQNGGVSGSVLHYSIDQVRLNWAGDDSDPNRNPAGFQKHPEQPLVPSEGTLKRGSIQNIKLASYANGNTVGGFPALQQGTYHGTLVVSDLADPADKVVVPVTLTLGDGKGTPRIGVTARSIKVTLAPGHSTVVDFGLTDPGGACGYGYSVGTSESWLSSDASRQAGKVSAHSTRRVPLRISAPAGMAPGVYHATVEVDSLNAAVSTLSVPVTLTVS